MKNDIFDYIMNLWLNISTELNRFNIQNELLNTLNVISTDRPNRTKHTELNLV